VTSKNVGVERDWAPIPPTVRGQTCIGSSKKRRSVGHPPPLALASVAWSLRWRC